jgi:hypothetical protein
MKRVWMNVVGGLVCFVAVQYAFAGAPLKGVDVKLGKNPGGTVAARVSGVAGDVNFGVLPKGMYTVTISAAKVTANTRMAKPERLHVEIRGASQGVMTHVLATASSDAVPIEIVSDGKTPLMVIVNDGQGEPLDAARIKSHSNSTNN